jgi:hypothetical protein
MSKNLTGLRKTKISQFSAQAQSDATARIEAVLRILKDRSTITEEAARLNVDVGAVWTWMNTIFATIRKSLGRRYTLANHKLPKQTY